jgi:hypothetical protein
MTSKEYDLSPKMMAAIKELIPEAIGVDFATMFEAYQLEGEGLTEQDLINEILEAGEYQAEDDSTFEDAVMIGAIAIGGPLGLV